MNYYQINLFIDNNVEQNSTLIINYPLSHLIQIIANKDLPM